MTNIDPDKTLLLCLDIDGTLISDYSDSFNEGLINWLNFLTKIQLLCDVANVRLLVQIPTSKTSVDFIVNKVVCSLNPFLKCVTKDGAILVPHPLPAGLNLSYYYLYHPETVYMKKNSLARPDWNLQTPYTPDNFLPPIHLCRKKKYDNYSKALVLQWISHYFGPVPIDAKNIFLLDDTYFVQEDILSGGYGQTPIYQFVLAEFPSTGHDNSLSALEYAIKARLIEILIPELSAEWLDQQEDTNAHTNDANHLYENIFNESLTQFDLAQQILVDMYFDEYLLYFREEADEKLKLVSRVLPQDLFAMKAAQAQLLYERLLQARITFLCSKQSIDEREQTFRTECTSAIADSEYATTHGDIFWGNTSRIQQFLVATRFEDYLFYLNNYQGVNILFNKAQLLGALSDLSNALKEAKKRLFFAGTLTPEGKCSFMMDCLSQIECTDEIWNMQKTMSKTEFIFDYFYQPGKSAKMDYKEHRAHFVKALNKACIPEKAPESFKLIQLNL